VLEVEDVTTVVEGLELWLLDEELVGEEDDEGEELELLDEEEFEVVVVVELPNVRA
jgi:hypothetical protein